MYIDINDQYSCKILQSQLKPLLSYQQGRYLYGDTFYWCALNIDVTAQMSHPTMTKAKQFQLGSSTAALTLWVSQADG